MVYWGVSRIATFRMTCLIYWPTTQNLPTVSIFQALHYDTKENHKRLKFFWTAFTGMFCFEVFPSYIFPLLNGINIVCLSTQHVSSSAQNVITNLFGGTNGNEGLGLLSISLDWQYIGSTYVSRPLVQQANSWIGYGLCYVIIMAIYYSNGWNSKEFPMLSTSLYSQNGTRYNQQAVFGSTFTLNQTALDIIGLPALTGSNAYANLTANLAVRLVFCCALYWK